MVTSRLNLSPSQQRTLHRYIKKDKSEPFPMRQQRTLHCYIEDYEIEPFPIPFQTSRHYFIPTENCDHQKRKNGLYPNQTVHWTQRKMNRAISTFPFRHQDIISSQQRTVTIKKGKTECISIKLFIGHKERSTVPGICIPTENSALLYRKRRQE